MLKIFFGADPAEFAEAQARHHAELAAGFEAVRESAGRGEVELTGGQRVVLETGIELHRWWERRWRELPASSLLE
jgi:hypothetical protein